MNKLFSIGFWSAVARFILRNRALIIIAIVGMTVFMGMQWKNMRFTYTEANLLPDDHKYNEEYLQFLDTFGEEGNLIILGVKDSSLFQLKNFLAWSTGSGANGPLSLPSSARITMVMPTTVRNTPR
ncbi:MAG: hypothetical protein JKY22_03925, partial [Flavobacteriaceae bacterium]|nr:hypothetical protein [Flavobacteriaceae bacterium]